MSSSKKIRKKKAEKTVKQMIPFYARPFASFIKKKQIGENEFIVEYNLSNVKINHALLPIYSIIILFVLNYFYNQTLKESAALAILSSLFYYWASIFFQPDLDIPARLNLFPFNLDGHKRKIKISNIVPILDRETIWGIFIPGRFFLLKWIGFMLIWVGEFRMFEFLHFATLPVRFVWSSLWIPFASLFTHRGAVHYPIVGVWLRVIWIHFAHLITMNLMISFGFELSMWNAAIDYWIRSFFPWNAEFGGKIFLIFCLPVYLSDLFHIGFDYFESKKNGRPFCSNLHKRGLFVRAFRRAKQIPGEISRISEKYRGK